MVAITFGCQLKIHQCNFINRGLYMTAWRYKTFLVSHCKILHERVVETLVKYFSTPKEKFISQCGHVVFYLLY